MPTAHPAHARIQALLAAHPVVLFMKGVPAAPQCGFSASAAGTLDDVGASYHSVDVLTDPELREGIKSYGDWPTIPQLYVHGELVGGSDIITQMAQSGELSQLLGLGAIDRTPPTIEVTPAALTMLRDAIASNGGGYVVEVSVDRQHRAQLNLAAPDATRITTQVDGVDFQFDVASARRAEGLKIDFADDARGRGLVVTHPLAAPPVRAIMPADAATRVAQGSLTLVDVRPADERMLATAPVAHLHLDAGLEPIEALPRTTPIAFLCHHGGRSAQAAEHVRGMGFTEVYNVTGGIAAWAQLDASIPRY